MKTNFSEAWLNFRRSKEYKNTCFVLKQQGIKPPYSGNILKNAFAAGWNASGIKIEIIQP